MLKKSLIFSGFMAIIAGNAFATGENIVTSKAYVDHEVATKQAILSAQDGDYAVIYPNSVNDVDDGAVTARAILTDVGAYDDGNELVTVGAVNTALAGKQNVLPNNTAGTLVTYNGAVGSVGSANIYNSSSSYSGQTDAIVRAEHVNAAVAAGFAEHLTCSNPPTCTLWQVNSTMNGTYVPQNQQ